MGHGGKKRKRVRVRDELRWYEILMCCCKCRKECKNCVTKLWLYFIPSILMILVSAGCIVFGILWRTDCDSHETIPYWLFGCAVSPYILLTFIKAVKEQYQGITIWRIVYFLMYLIFTAWLVYGCLLVYEMWIDDPNGCNKYLKWFAFYLTFLHWVIFIIATVIVVYLWTRICCCCTQNAIKPLKPSFVHDEYI